jgi:hypothetical protein
MKKIVVVIFITMIAFLSAKASDLKFSGNWNYNIDKSLETVRITGDKLKNSSDWKSGSIKIMLYLTQTKYSDGSINGYVLAEYQFDQLEDEHYYYDIDKTLDFKDEPSSGSFFITLILAEYTDNGYVIRDFRNSDEIISFYESTTYVNPFITINPGYAVNPVYIVSPPPARKTCYECRGTCHCIVCKGTGTYSMFGQSSRCSGCSGTGTCTRCYGTGFEN